MQAERVEQQSRLYIYNMKLHYLMFTKLYTIIYGHVLDLYTFNCIYKKKVNTNEDRVKMVMYDCYIAFKTI